MLDFLYAIMAVAMIVSTITIVVAVIYHILAWQGYYKRAAWDEGAEAAKDYMIGATPSMPENPYDRRDK